MSWTKGKRRNDSPECAELIRGIGSVRSVAFAAKVSPRAVQFWRSGKKRPSMIQLMAVINHLLPAYGAESEVISGSGLSEDYMSQGLPFGVGQYTLESSYVAVGDLLSRRDHAGISGESE